MVTFFTELWKMNCVNGKMYNDWTTLKPNECHLYYKRKNVNWKWLSFLNRFWHYMLLRYWSSSWIRKKNDDVKFNFMAKIFFGIESRIYSPQENCVHLWLHISFIRAEAKEWSDWIWIAWKWKFQNIYTHNFMDFNALYVTSMASANHFVLESYETHIFFSDSETRCERNTKRRKKKMKKKERKSARFCNKTHA